MHTYLPTYIHAYIRRYIHTCIHKCIQHTNTCMHTNIHTCILSSITTSTYNHHHHFYSTLLDLIADRKLYGTWSGSILIDDAHRTPIFRREIAYILHDDIFINTLTVEETLQYLACSLLPNGTSTEALQDRVDEVMSVMGLSIVRNVVIGRSARRNITQGQLKCLSIAKQIIAYRKLLFLDDPTSGLDYNIANDVIKSVRKVVTTGSTCLVAMNQPSGDAFACFDKFVLLSSGKHYIYLLLCYTILCSTH